MVAAYQAQDFAAMVLAAENALRARPRYPGALFNLAFAQVLSGDATASLHTLHYLLDREIDFAVADIDEFAPLRTLDGWQRFAEQVAVLYEPMGSASVYARLDGPQFIPEGIAFDAAGALYLGSVREGKLLRLGETVETLSDRAGHWSVFGIRPHADGSLWFASAAVPQLANVGEDAGQTGLFRLDPGSGKITRAALLPQLEESQVLGDLVIADDNTMYTTDSLTGAVYRYYADSNEFETLVEPGVLRSPQGLVLDANGENLYVADYIGGLHTISLDDGTVLKMTMHEGASDIGIDGLYRYGSELIAIQNGIRPHRVVAMQLDSAGQEVTGVRRLVSGHADFDEPTLGVVRGDDFYFVANSHWNRFDRDNNLPEGLSGPVVLRVSLRSPLSL